MVIKNIMKKTPTPEIQAQITQVTQTPVSETLISDKNQEYTVCIKTKTSLRGSSKITPES